MILYVRNKSRWINFIHNLDEFKEFEAMYIQGRKLVIGDLSQFSKPMMFRLLKFIEENPEVDCYTSKDINDGILLSRFIEIVKEPLILDQSHSIDDFNQSNRDYMAAVTNLARFSNESKLRVPLIKHNMINLLEAL